MPAITIIDLENAASDVATIGSIANSTEPTVTDRLGAVRPTMTALAAEYPAAAENAASALVSKNAATASEAAALASKVSSESARDAAIIGAGVYTTEALGRAAVADGVAFKVQGSGDVAAYEYRRTNSTTSVLIATYPSSASVASAEDAVRNVMTQPNLFLRGQLLAQVMPSIFVSGVAAPGSVGGAPTVKLTAPVSTAARYAWRFARSLIAGDLVSMSIVIAQANLGAGTNQIKIICRNAAGSQLTATVATGVTSAAISEPSVMRLSNVSIPADCVSIDLDVSFTASASEPKEIHFRGMYLGGGASAAYRNPDELPALDTRLVAAESGIVTLAASVGGLSSMVSSTAAAATTPPAYFGKFTGFPARVAARVAGLGLTLTQAASGALSFGFSARNEASLSSSKTTYYFSQTGSDSNSGLTRALPKKSLGIFIGALTATTDIEIILIGAAPGIYYRGNSLASYTWSQPYHLSIVAESEALITSAEPFTSLTWGAVGAAWQCTRTSVGSVFDAALRDYRGIPYRLKLVASVAAVQAEAGTWYTDGTLLTVRLHNSRAPDASLLPMIESGRFTCIPVSGKTVYFENIKFGLFNSVQESVRVAVATGNTGYLTQKNCAFFAGGRNGLGADQVTRAYSENCTAAHNGYDGFNYHDNLAAPQAVAVEVGCHSYDNGLVNGTGTNNGSTAHDGMTMLRVGGLYFNCNGPVVADVNGCISFSVNSIAARSVLAGSGGTVASWYFDDALALADGETWLIGCGSHDSLYDISSDTGAVINVRGWRGASPLLGPTAAITKI